LGHDAGAQHVDDHLLGRPRLEACGAREDLRAGYRLNGDLRHAPRLASLNAGDAHRQCPGPAGIGEDPEHVGGPPTRSQADDRVRWTDAEGAGIGRAGRRGVLHPLGGAPECLGATRHARLNHRLVSAEGRLTLGGIQHPEPTARPRTEVDHPAAGTKPLGDSLDGGGDGRRCGADGRDHLGIDLVHKRHQGQGRQLIEPLGARMPSLGGKFTDTAGHVGAPPRRTERSRRLVRRLGEKDHEARPSAWRALDPHPAPALLDGVLDDAQPEARAAQLA